MYVGLDAPVHVRPAWWPTVAGLSWAAAALTTILALGGAMMHAMVTPDDRRADLARSTGSYAAPLVSFLLRAVPPA